MCLPLRNVFRPSKEFDDVPQITIKFTLETNSNNRTRVNTSYILGHGTEKV